MLCLLRIGNRRRSFAHEISISVKERKKEIKSKEILLLLSEEEEDHRGLGFCLDRCWRKNEQKPQPVMETQRSETKGDVLLTRSLSLKKERKKEQRNINIIIISSNRRRRRSCVVSDSFYIDGGGRTKTAKYNISIHSIQTFPRQRRKRKKERNRNGKTK